MNIYPEDCEVSEEMQATGRSGWQSRGKPHSSFAKRRQFLGIIAVADVIKEDSPESGKRTAEYGNPRCHAHR